MIRKNVHAPFGFGVASLWSLQGRYNVVSDIDPNGLASQHDLQVEDILLRIDNEVRSAYLLACLFPQGIGDVMVHQDVDEEHVDRVKGLLREASEFA
jgi:hypothetical protein